MLFTLFVKVVYGNYNIELKSLRHLIDPNGFLLLMQFFWSQSLNGELSIYL